MSTTKVLKTASSLIAAATANPTAAIILAAGHSTRMGGVDKQMERVGGIPVLARTVKAYSESPVISEIVIVTREEEIASVKELVAKYRLGKKISGIVIGGKTRQESAKCGMKAVDLRRIKFVAIADGARCLITPEDVNRVCGAAYRHNAASAGHLISDTVKRTDILGKVKETIDRQGLWQAQTPQVFQSSLYVAAIARAESDGFTATDDNSLIEHLGFTVQMVECGAYNLKITTPDDLPIAEAILRYRDGEKS